MKINEIALNENVWTDAAKLAGKALPRIERLPGETMIDAIKRTTSELGGVKSADNLASPSGPAVWRKRGDPNFDTTPSTLQGPSTSGTVSKPIVPAPKPRANTSAYDREVRNAHDLNPGMPNKGKPSSEAEKYLELKQAQAARTAAEKQAAADDLARQVSPADDLSKEIKPGGQAYPEMIAEPLPSWLSPKGAKGSKTTGGRQEPSINRPADDLAKQIKPGAKAPKTTGGRQEPSMNQSAAPANGINLSKDEVLDLIKNKPGSAAAQAAAKEVGLDKNPGIFRRNPWKTVIGVAVPDLYNQFSPPTAKKLPYTPGEAAVDLFNYAGTNLMANHGKAGVDKVVPNTTPAQTDKEEWTPPSQDAVDKAKDTDPEHQAAIQAKEKWNREHPDDPIKEGYTNELNRIVFLSRP